MVSGTESVCRVSNPGSIAVIMRGMRANMTAATRSTKVMAICATIRPPVIRERMVAVPSLALERGNKIQFPRSMHRSERRSDSGYEDENSEIAEDAPVRVHERDEGSLVLICRIHDDLRHAVGQDDAQQSSDQCSEKALEHQHAQQSRPTYAKRQPYSDLAAPHDRPGEKQQGHIAASQQEHQESGPRINAISAAIVSRYAGVWMNDPLVSSTEVFRLKVVNLRSR